MRIEFDRGVISTNTLGKRVHMPNYQKNGREFKSNFAKKKQCFSLLTVAKTKKKTQWTGSLNIIQKFSNI